MDKTADHFLVIKARGDRAKSLRTALRLNRPDCAKKFNIPVGSLQNWEDARHGGLTQKGAKRLLEAYQQEGILCSLSWLLEGEGPPPTLSHRPIPLFSDSEQTPAPVLALDDHIQQELFLFYRHNKNAIDTIILDNLLAPYLKQGDQVAGVRYFFPDIEGAVGNLCIVQTVAGETLTGFLQMNDENQYTLCTFGPAGKVTIEENLALFSVAPILWIRRRITSL